MAVIQSCFAASNFFLRLKIQNSNNNKDGAEIAMRTLDWCLGAEMPVGISGLHDCLGTCSLDSEQG